MIPIESFSHEELVIRIQELEAQVEKLRREIMDQERLDFAWTGNLGHWYWDYPANKVTFNPRKVLQLGFSIDEIPESVSYQYFTDMLHPDDYEITMDAMRQHMMGQKEAYEIEYRIRTKTGGWRWYYDIGRITKRDENGQILLIAGIVFDITERKEMQAEIQATRDSLALRVEERTAELKRANINLEKALRAKDEFIAAMSHELRTPLTGILGLAEVLQMPHYGQMSEKQSKAVMNIESSGKRLLSVINDVIDYSKLQGGSVTTHPVWCSLANLSRTALQAIQHQAKLKHQEASLSIPSVEIKFQCDEQLVHRILLRLLSNASKFTPEGGQFGIESLADENSRQINITVWDHGIGISDQDLQRIFQPFVQLDAQLSRHYEGTGLGLALARQLADVVGGSISVTSVFGYGARFTLTLPWVE